MRSRLKRTRAPRISAGKINHSGPHRPRTKSPNLAHSPIYQRGREVKTFNHDFPQGGFTVNDNENRRRQMFARVQDFVTAHANDFAPTSLGKELSKTLATIITELDGHASSEASGIGSERQGTSTRGLARGALRDDLEAINRTARAMAGDVPGIEEKFR